MISMDNDTLPPKIFFIDSMNSREKGQIRNKGRPEDNFVYVNNPIMPDIEDIAERDKKILTLRDLLQKNKEEFKINQAKIESETKNNSYLKDVLKNYQSYKDYIVNMKKKQKEAMEKISSHLEKMTNENVLGKENLERVKMERNQILDELDNIKNELQELTLKI
tara:strand:- start:214 stop:705 length:492 start_codon:yes stop_codon:yes gene_type:complete